MSSMNIVYFGTPWFAAHILEYIAKTWGAPCAIVTKEDKPIGRSSKLIPPPVKQVADNVLPGVPVFQPSKVSTQEMEEVLKKLNPDLFVVVAYGEIVSKNILNLPRLGCINVHASLLPKLRGASPIQQAIIEGHAVSGVTIMEMVEKMDAGDIISTAEVPISDEMTAGELEAKLCEISCPLLCDVLEKFERGEVKKKAQDHTQATYVKKILSQHCKIDWTRSAQEIHNLVRGLQPRPGAWTEVGVGTQVKRLKIHKTVVVDMPAQPKEIIEYSKDRILVGTGDGALQLLSLQPEGKKAMSARDFVLGSPSLFFA